ncbi:MAG: DUF2202 domain-containing protein [Kineosporiaceae bacterium]|nr:DUF2202 domain-containing protein [Kineosporiaceae bacterium]
MPRPFTVTAATVLAGGALAAVLAGTSAAAGSGSTSGVATATASAAAGTATGTTCPYGTGGCTEPGQQLRQGNSNGNGNNGNGNGNGNGNAQGNGRGNGQGQGQGQGARQGRGMQQGPDAGTHAMLPASGTLTAQQKVDLAAMAEEEKLAHDVYVALAASTGDQRFTRIASSESRHLSAVRTVLQRYGITDPTAGLADGRFADRDTAALYTKLVAQGRASLTAALEVGRTVETMDIADLNRALSGLNAPDVQQVYSSLLAGSRNHLRAFGG